MLAAAALAFVLAAQNDSALARAESLLAAGDLRAARRIAERLQDIAPADPRVLILLARIHLEWPVIGRFAAESLLNRAARLAPENPEPFYWLGHVGLRLGGDDGESIARRGLLRVLELNPSYRDAWQLWNRLYAGNEHRRAALRALDRHAGDYEADLRRAQLLVDLGEYAGAGELLVNLAGRRGRDARPVALHARAFFEQGLDEPGWAVYQRAMALAPDDADDAVWSQIRSIATPAEREQWNATPPGRRDAFLRSFWSRREPDMFTDVNERIGEHFRRMVEARRDFRLLHPNSRYHRSRLYRSLMGGVNVVRDSEVGALVQRAQMEQCAGNAPDSLTRLQYARGLSPRTDSSGRQESDNVEDGLDDRGRIWVRHGRPDVRLTYGLGGETWCYLRNGRVFRVTFARRTGPYGVSGDVIVTPVQPGEVAAAAALLATDRAGRKFDLNFAFWPALFRSADGARTDIYLFPDSVEAIGSLVDDAGFESGRDTTSGGFLRIAVQPGRYLLRLDARRGSRHGSFRGSIPVADFSTGELAISSLLVAPGGAAASRDSMAAMAPAALRLAAGTALRFYAELYGLGRVNDVSRYEARYHFERIGGGEGDVVIGFSRQTGFAPRVVETLVVDPDRLPAGRYRVRLEIADQVRATTAVSASMEFLLR